MKFDEFNFNDYLKKALIDLDFYEPTKIQEKSIQNILDGRDLLGIAKTGSGKTAAFSLPILDLILKNRKGVKIREPRFVIIAPTRELVVQIGENIRNYSKYTSLVTQVVYGGVKPEKQIDLFSQKIDILVSTPKRLFDLIKEKNVSLNSVDYFVIDEADKIIELSIDSDLRFIFQQLPIKRQTLFFSATFSAQVEKLANFLLKKAIKVKIEEGTNAQIFEKVLYVKKENKDKLLLELLNKKEIKKGIIFANTKIVADNLVRFLVENKIKTEALHSNKSNTHRLKVMEHIRTGNIKFLIATDLASRGLDIPNITHIINYEMPPKVEDYIHRIGRCGRAEKEGTALTFCSIEERSFFKKIENNRNIEMLTHSFHSDVAKKATGKEAKVKFKKVKHNFRPKTKKKTNYSNRRNKR